jgi:hypothetical protein
MEWVQHAIKHPETKLRKEGVSWTVPKLEIGMLRGDNFSCGLSFPQEGLDRAMGPHGPGLRAIWAPFTGRPMGPKGPINFYWLAYQNANLGANTYFYAFFTRLSGFYQVIYHAFIGLIYKVSNCSWDANDFRLYAVHPTNLGLSLFGGNTIPEPKEISTRFIFP